MGHRCEILERSGGPKAINVYLDLRLWQVEYNHFKTPNGFYALCLVGDGSFTQAYRLTVALMQNGRAKDAYFAEASSWGTNLLEP